MRSVSSAGVTAAYAAEATPVGSRDDLAAYAETLAEAGAYSDGIEYSRIGTGWRIKVIQGGMELTLSSRDALANFIGRSFEVIARRTQ